MSKDDMAKLRTLCLPFSISVSVKRVCRVPILLSNFDRQHLPLCPPHQYCSLRTQFVLQVEYFCVDVKHKSREILHGIVYTCMLLKVLEHCLSWLHGISNHPGTMLRSRDTVCNIGFQLSISFASYNIVSCSLGTTIFTCDFFFSN